MDSPLIFDELADAGVSELTFEQLFASEETPLLHYTFSLVGRRSVAEEIVQDVFLQLHLNWKTVTSPKAWLKRCVRNRAFSYLRDHKQEFLKEPDRAWLGANTDSEPPETAMIRMEAIAAVRKFVEKLDEGDRKLVKLKYSDDLKYREISTQTGLKIGNVGYRLHHILKELASQLRKLGFDEQS